MVCNFVAVPADPDREELDPLDVSLVVDLAEDVDVSVLGGSSFVYHVGGGEVVSTPYHHCIMELGALEECLEAGKLAAGR